MEPKKSRFYVDKSIAITVFDYVSNTPAKALLEEIVEANPIIASCFKMLEDNNQAQDSPNDVIYQSGYVVYKCLENALKTKNIEMPRISGKTSDTFFTDWQTNGEIKLRRFKENLETFNGYLYQAINAFTHIAEDYVWKTAYLTYKHVEFEIVLNEIKNPEMKREEFKKRLESIKPITPEFKRISIDWEKPKSIYEYLDKFVAGQDDAKKVLSIALSNYIIRSNSKDEKLPKNNVLLVGPSGVGKTYMASLLAKESDIPFIKASAGGKSYEGLVGDNFSSFWDSLMSKSNNPSPEGIVFIDEIDKIANYGYFDTMNQKLQDELITWMEEGVIRRRDSNNKEVIKEINTKNIMFILAGAFQGNYETKNALEQIIENRRSKGKSQLGFNGNVEKEKPREDSLKNVIPIDLINYGLKPELVGRFNSIAVLDNLTIEDKIRILDSLENSTIPNYQALFKKRGYNLIFEDGVSRIIAQRSPKETGARALKAICSNLFDKILFEPEKFESEIGTILISKELAERLILIENI